MKGNKITNNTINRKVNSEKIAKPKVRKSKKAKKFFEYKGLPIVRCGNVIYYGKMSDKFITKIEVKETQNIGDLKVGNNLSVELLSTDLEDLTSIIKEEGRYYFEIGYDQGAAVKGLLEQYGYQQVKVIQDYAGLDRVVCGCRPACYIT